MKGIGCNAVSEECVDGQDYNTGIYEGCLDRIKFYGYTHVEFSHVVHLSFEDTTNIGGYTRKAGLIPWSIHSEHLNDASPAAVEDYLLKQERCAKACRLLGATIMVIHPPNITADIKRDMDIVGAVAEIGRNNRVRIALENTSARTIRETVSLVECLDIENLGFTLDTGHALLAGFDPAQAARMMGNRLWHTHMQDNLGQNDDHLPPGLGVLNWNEIIRTLIQVGYAGPLMRELTGPGIKAKRKDELFRTLSTEKEMEFGIKHLKSILQWRI